MIFQLQKVRCLVSSQEAGRLQVGPENIQPPCRDLAIDRTTTSVGHCGGKKPRIFSKGWRDGSFKSPVLVG